MLEKQIEQYLVRKVQDAGGMAPKFNSVGRRSVPDRIVLLPGGKIRFVELKAPGKYATPLQEREHKRLRALGFQVDVLDSKDAVNRWMAKEVG